MTETDSLSALTRAVGDSFAATPDPRLRAIMGALVRHLHGFAREVALTEAEWAQAIDFLTRTGQKCDTQRQEYILLSDVLGLSMLVVGMAEKGADARTTRNTVLGPFFVEDAPEMPQFADLGAGQPGDPLFVDIRVRDTDGAAIDGATVHVWQSDDEGLYDVQHDAAEPMLRGIFRTDGDGRLRFRSIVPPPYSIPTDGPVGELLNATARSPWRPAHVHFRIDNPGYRRVVTHLFPQEDRHLETDAVFGVKDALVVPFERHGPGTAPDGRRIETGWRSLTYDFVLTAGNDADNG